MTLQSKAETLERGSIGDRFPDTDEATLNGEEQMKFTDVNEAPNWLIGFAYLTCVIVALLITH